MLAPLLFVTPKVTIPPPFGIEIGTRLTVLLPNVAVHLPVIDAFVEHACDIIIAEAMAGAKPVVASRIA